MTAFALRQTTANSDQELQKAAEDLFLRRQFGHLDSFCYSAPNYQDDPVCGAAIWTRLLQHNRHYNIPAKEAALIKNAEQCMRGFSGSFEQFIDFGPGSVEAFNAKTRPLINELDIATYRPIDICSHFLSEIGIVMKYTNPKIKIRAEQADFLNDYIAPSTGPSWLFWGGSGFANIPTIDRSGLPVDGIRSRLKLMKQLLPKGGHALITLDTMNDPNALMLAYSHPMVVLFITNLLHQIKRDCPDILLDTNGWTYRPVWNPDRYLIEHHLVALRPQMIYLPDHVVSVEPGESFIAEHSFKIPTLLIAEIAESIGWSHTTTLGDDGQVQLLILSC